MICFMKVQMSRWLVFDHLKAVTNRELKNVLVHELYFLVQLIPNAFVKVNWPFAYIELL